MIRRKIALIFIITMILSAMTGLAAVENVTRTTYQNGIQIVNIKRLTIDGWQNIHILEADTSTGRIALDLLYSDKGLGTLETVETIIDQNNAIAAINADFFAWGQESGQGSAAGFNAKDGEILSTASKDEYLATMAFGKDGSFLMEYFDSYLTLTNVRGETKQVRHLNKYDPLVQICAYTRAFSTMSFGASGNMVEVIVEDNIVKDIRRNAPPTEIPENGYLLRSLADHDNFLTDYIAVGEPLYLENRLAPNFDARLAIGGGTILVKNGQATTIMHGPAGRHPRSAIGLDRTGSVVYLVAVDGRGYGDSIGMSLPELQQFFLDYGIYNGMNLDGGGSTQLGVRDGIVNNPSENRRVSNAAGIVGGGQEGELWDVGLSIDRGRMFMGTGAPLNITIFDGQYNPMEYEESEMIYEVSGGVVLDHVFYPHTTGTATITAHYRGISGRMQVQVMDPPAMLYSKKERYDLRLDSQMMLALYGVDQNGEMYYINPMYAGFEATGGIAKTVRNGIYGLAPGSGTMTFLVGEAHLTLHLSVSTEGTNNAYDDIPFLFNDPLIASKTDADISVTAGMFENRTVLQNLCVLKASKHLMASQKSLALSGRNVMLANNDIGRVAPGRYETGDITVLQVPNLPNGIKTYNNLDWFCRNIDSIATPAAILVMNHAPEFDTMMEQELFHNKLQQAKERGIAVFVTWQGSQTGTTIKNGVRFVTLKISNPSILTRENTLDILHIYSQDGQIQYQVEKHAFYEFS